MQKNAEMVAFDVPRTHANCGTALPDPTADRSATQRSVEYCDQYWYYRVEPIKSR